MRFRGLTDTLRLVVFPVHLVVSGGIDQVLGVNMEVHRLRLHGCFGLRKGIT